MIKLADLQQELIEQLTGTTVNNDFLNRLTACGNLNPKQQLAVYKNNNHSALQKALRQVYPVCHKILGENYFRQVCRTYIENHHSKHHDLNNYGEYFSDFLESLNEQHEELDDYPYLADLAQLEWFYHQIYFSAEPNDFEFNFFTQLSQSQQAEVSFILSVGFKYNQSDYPVVSLWQHNQNLQNVDQMINAESQSYCIYRQDFNVEIKQITNCMYNLLSSIATGARLKTLSQMDDDNNLPALINSGWVSGFKVNHV